jgi:hypothetical protein
MGCPLTFKFLNGSTRIGFLREKSFKVASARAKFLMSRLLFLEVSVSNELNKQSTKEIIANKIHRIM